MRRKLAKHYGEMEKIIIEKKGDTFI